jgi:2-polyprenyl-3-methyl-5-hydroxy-6-metoxy-1,4-benzoquinol methylase
LTTKLQSPTQRIPAADAGHHLDCPVCTCSFEIAEPLQTAGSYSLFECPGCEVQFWNPFKRIGSSWYEEFYTVRLKSIPPLEPGHKFFLADPLAPKACRLFDIGCGVGNFMAAAREQGYNVTGIDWDTKAIQAGKEILHLDTIFPLSIEEYAEKNAGETFDVVSFFEVLEHQDDPAGFMSQVRRLVKPSGFIALSVPNRNRFQKGLDTTDLPPNHLTRWNPQVLKTFLQRQGFEIISCREEPLSLTRTALMLSAAVPTGLARAVLGGTQPNSTDVAENPEKARATFKEQQQFGRSRITTILIRVKNSLFFVPAFFCLPILRAKKYPGIYLYCLAKLKDR